MISMRARLGAVLCVVATLALAGCETPPPPLLDSGPQTAAVVACIRTNAHGRALDGYVLNSSGDPATVKSMFDYLMWEGTPETVVDWNYAGWALAEMHEKNGPTLPMPPTCGPRGNPTSDTPPNKLGQ